MRTALVVGGAGGLGGALVRALADAGRHLAVAGRSPAADPRVRSNYRIDATAVDWRKLYSDAEADLAAPLGAILFVAGSAVFGKTASIPIDRARRTFELNFWACAHAATDAAAHWAQRGGQGTFVAVLSIVARRAVPFEAYYSASKAATARFLECLDLEHGHAGRRFLCAFPGTIRTPFRRSAEWYGLEPDRADGGAEAPPTARAIVDLLEGRRRTRVIGWRERTIDLADRVWPGLYDRTILRHRIGNILKQRGEG